MNNWQARAILFLIAGAGLILSLQYIPGHFKADRQLILLNTTRPDFKQFLAIEKESAGFSRSSLKGYVSYFHLVAEAMPANSEALLMLGYLDDVTGDKDQAQVLLQKAQVLDPSFFYTIYDLAVVSYEKGDYAQCAQLLQKALAIPPQATLGRMMNSIIYRQLLSSMPDSRDIVMALRQSYQDAYALLVDASARNSGQEGANASPQVYARIM